MIVIAELEATNESRSPTAGASGVSSEALRYLAASLAALALDAGLLWVGASGFGLAPWLAGALSYAAGLVLIYVLSTRWAFRERAFTDARSEFVVFAILGVAGLILNSMTLYVASALGIHLSIAKVLSAGGGFIVNFVTRKVFLFSCSHGRA